MSSCGDPECTPHPPAPHMTLLSDFHLQWTRVSKYKAPQSYPHMETKALLSVHMCTCELISGVKIDLFWKCKINVCIYYVLLLLYFWLQVTSTNDPSPSGTTKCIPPWGDSSENSIPIRSPLPSPTKWEASSGIWTWSSPELWSGSIFWAADKWYWENTSKDLL